MSLYPIELFYEAIQKEEYFQIGTFKKPIGKDGGLVALFVAYSPAELAKLPALFVEIDNEKVPYTIKNIIHKAGKAIIHLDLIPSKTKAYTLRNLSLFLPIALQPKWEQSMLPYSLVGAVVEDIALGSLGSIQAIYRMRDQYMMGVDHPKKELLIPYSTPFLINVNTAAKKVTVALPEGYLEAML
ncbi:ribosome maturation factor RimM [Candidatus Cardinium hertigii]|uniref:ribosome maturation factor RimM n=1 Tax=Candidatus Cardinium hertigii TaxID=247481 RepID=UPI003D7D1C66